MVLNLINKIGNLIKFCYFTEVTDELNKPAIYPGCTGTRNLTDNLSDLRAQVAANQKVSSLMR